MKASALLALVAPVVQAALPVGWAAVAGQAADYADRQADLALYDGMLAASVFGGALTSTEVLSVRLTLAAQPSLAASYAALLDVRDAVGAGLIGAAQTWDGLGVVLVLDRSQTLGMAAPAMNAANQGFWSCEVKLTVERRLG